MVRTISATLRTAIGANTRRPAIKLEAKDPINHLNNTVSTGGNADAPSDACIANDGSLIRVRVTWGGGFGFTQTFQWQRITDPTNASQWTTWTTFGGGSGNIFDTGGCAVSNNGGTIRAFAQQGSGGNALWTWSSANNGQSWSGAPSTILSPPGNALIRGIGSAGNNDVFFLYDVLGGTAIGASFFSGAWSALISSNGVIPLLSVNGGSGIAVIWNNSSAKYTLISSDNLSIFLSTYKPSGSTWTTGSTIAQGTITSIGRVSPRLSLINGIYHLVYCEVDNGALTGTVYSYPRVRQSTDLINWSNGFILHDMTTSLNCNILQNTFPNTSRAIYIAITAQKIEYNNAYSPSDAIQYLDLSPYVLEYHRSEEAGKASKLTVILDNSNAALTPYVAQYGNTYQPIGINTTLILSEGYYTGTPPTTKELVQVAQYRVKQIAFQRAPGENQIQIVAEDISRYLDFENRYQYSSTNTTVQTIMQQICVLSGVLNYNIPNLTQLQANMITFVLNAGQAYRKAIDELAKVGWVEYFIDQNEVFQVLQLNANDPVVWTYNPEIETLVIGNDDENANHIVVSGKPPAGPGTVIGSVTNGETFDDTNLHVTGIEKIHLYSDIKLANTSLAQSKASFLLAQEERDLTAHAITVPANPALQLIDVISIADQNPPVGIGRSANVRIWKQEVHYQAQDAEFEQTLYLEGV